MASESEVNRIGCLAVALIVAVVALMVVVPLAVNAWCGARWALLVACVEAALLVAFVARTFLREYRDATRDGGR